MPFAGYPAPFVHDEPGGRIVQQLLWGDAVEVSRRRRDGWRQVTRARNSSGWMRDADLQDEAVLEVSFIDVGQGDGALVVTPRGERIVVDAGKADNLYWFLRWRYDLRRHPDRVLHLDHVVITHPDADHYQGFEAIFSSPQFTIGTLHHNGLVERAGDDSLGPTTEHDGRSYLTELVTSKAKLRRLLRDDATVGRKAYPRLLRTALEHGRVADIRMTSAADRFLPGYEAPPLVAEVVSPVPERVGRRRGLRRLGDDGVTKNGHSVGLRLRYRDVRILLAGDLNLPAQNYLLEHYGGGSPSVGDDGWETVAAAARATFGAEIAKSCHHGSGDFSEVFLTAVNAVVTVVSSGDDEPYAHPRPDALGALGRYGAGIRPLIFSTELARSTREHSHRPETLRATMAPTLDAARAEVDAGAPSSEERPGRLVAHYQRAVAVYGMINVRTDGTRVLVAQKLERMSGRGKEWDYHCLEPVAGRLTYVPH